MQHNNQSKSISDLILNLRGLVVEFIKENYDPIIMQNFKSSADGRYDPWSSDPPDIASVKDFLNQLQNIANLVSNKQGGFTQFGSAIQLIRDYYGSSDRPTLPAHIARHMQTLPPMQTLLSTIPMIGGWIGKTEPSNITSPAIEDSTANRSQSIAFTALEMLKDRATLEEERDSITPLLNVLQTVQQKIVSYVHKLPFQEQRKSFDSLKDDGTYKINNDDTSGIRGIKSLLNSVVKLQSVLREWSTLKDKSKLLHPLSTGSILLDVKNVIDSFKGIAKLDPTDEVYVAVKTLLGALRPFVENMTVQIDKAEGALGLRENAILEQITPLIESFETATEITGMKTYPTFSFWDSRLQMREAQLELAEKDKNNAELLSGLLVTRGVHDGEYYPHNLNDLLPEELIFISQHLHLLPLKKEILARYKKAIDEKIEFPRTDINKSIGKLHDKVVAKEATTLVEKMHQRTEILERRVISAKMHQQDEMRHHLHTEDNLRIIIQDVGFNSAEVIMSPKNSRNKEAKDEVENLIKIQLEKSPVKRAIVMISNALSGEQSGTKKANQTIDFIKNLIILGSKEADVVEKIKQKLPNFSIDMDMQLFITAIVKINGGPDNLKKRSGTNVASEPNKVSCSTSIVQNLIKQNSSTADPKNNIETTNTNSTNLNMLTLITQARKTITQFIKTNYDSHIVESFVASRDEDKRYECYPGDPPDIEACKNLLNLLIDVSNVIDSEQSILTRYKSALLSVKYFLNGGLDEDKDKFLMYFYRQTNQLQQINPILLNIIRDCKVLMVGGADITNLAVSKIADSYASDSTNTTDNKTKLAGNILKTTLTTMQERSESSERDRDQTLVIELTENIRKVSGDSEPNSPRSSNRDKQEIPLLKLLSNMSMQTKKYLHGANSLLPDDAAKQDHIYTIDDSDTTDKRGAKLLSNSIVYLQKVLVGWEKIKDKQKILHMLTTADVVGNVKRVIAELSKLASLDKRAYGDIYAIVQENLNNLRPVLVDFAKFIDQTEGQFRLREGTLFNQFESLFQSFEKASHIAEVQNGPRYPFWQERAEARKD